MQSNKVLVIAALCSVAACGEDAGEVDVELDSMEGLSQGITNGVQDWGHPSVGKIYSGNKACTGTLIGNKTVLTAAHCIGSDRVVFVTGDGYWHWGNRSLIPAWATKSRDLAVVQLDSPVSGVTPMPICDLRSESLGGMYVILVGYGRWNAGVSDYGTKRMGVSRVRSATSTSITIKGTSHTCYGDSGGPALMQFLPPPPPPGNPPPPPKECIVGVSSILWYPACENQEAHTRADAYGGWINDAARDSSIKWLDIPRSRHYPVAL